MDTNRLIRLLPTMEIVEEAFQLAGWKCTAVISRPEQVYRNVRLFTGRQELQPDLLYALRPGETDFPTDRFSYICTTPIEGKADHIICPEMPPEILLDELMELFSRYQQKEMRIDQATYQDATLQELCELGAQLLGNPVCIHDDWFIMTGLSRDAEQIIIPEYVMSSSRSFLPRAILDAFRDDTDYLETYTHPDPRIWHGANGAPDSLYINLWDGKIYRGRFLVIRHNRDFRKSDFLLAEILAQRAVFLQKRKAFDQESQYKSMDDILFGLLQGRPAEEYDLSHVLNMLSWNKRDNYLCVSLRSREKTRNTVEEHMLHSDLFQKFPGSYILFSGQDQHMVVNINRDPITQAALSRQLEELCGEYRLYVGVSSPVADIRELHLAYSQAEAALEQAISLPRERPVVFFSGCVLEYLMKHMDSPLPAWTLVSPKLLAMRKHDQENGTQYFETFREYLLNERDIPKTAEKLIIHRTTLLYRLKRIQSQFCLELEDPWTRLYLMFSLWLMEREERQKKQ